MTNENQTILIKFPVFSFRKIESPYEVDGNYDYFMVVNIKDLPKSLEEWREINVRDAKLTSNVSKGIKDTLESSPESFFFKNRGLTLIVEKMSFDPKTRMVEMELKDKKHQGLLDGGHTFSVIQQYLEEYNNPSDALVRVEVIEGFADTDDIVGIVEARNKSTQVQEQGIQELLNKFEPIKKVLKRELYADKIGYKEYELSEDGDRKNIDIKEILSYLLCFYIDDYGRDSHPTKAYTQKTGIVRQYAKDMDDETGKKTFEKIIPLLPDILKLRDVIEAEFKETYNKIGRKFALLEGIKEKKTGQKPVILNFTGKAIDYSLPSAYVYPLLAAFRANINRNGDKCSWKKDPIKLFNQTKDLLVGRLAEHAKYHKNPDKLAKDTTVWGRCYDLILLETIGS